MPAWRPARRVTRPNVLDALRDPESHSPTPAAVSERVLTAHPPCERAASCRASSVPLPQACGAPGLTRSVAS